MARKKSIIPGFSLNRALGITSAKQKIARATGIPTTKQGRKRKMQSHLWTAAAAGVAAACSSPRRSTPQNDSGYSDNQYYGNGGYDPEPPKWKPLYKRKWFWVLLIVALIIVIPRIKVKVAEMQAARNQREEARVLAELAEREKQKQAEAVASEPDAPAEDEQPSTTEDHYTSDDPAPEQEEPEAEDAVPETSDTVIAEAEPEATDNVTTIVVPVTPSTETTASSTEPVGQTYVLNTSTHKFHYQSCSSVKKIDPENYSTYTGTRDSVISMGYEACGRCHP